MRAGQFVFLSGQVATDYVNGVPSHLKKDPNFPNYLDEMEKQAEFIYENISTILKAANSSISDIVKVIAWHTNQAQLGRHLAVRSKYFGGVGPAPSTAVETDALLIPGTTLDMDVIAQVSSGEYPREVVEVEGVPIPVQDSIYGQPIFVLAVKAGDFVFTCGLTASDMKVAVAPEAQINPELPYFGSRIKKQTTRTLEDLKNLLESAGTSLDHVVYAEVHLSDVSEFAGMDEVWRQYFPSDPPARTVVPVRSLVFPGLAIEVSLIAVMPNAKLKKTTVSTSKAPLPTTYEPQAIKVGDYVFLSGLLPTDWVSGVAAEASVNAHHPFEEVAVAKQMRYILQNAEQICSAAGTSLRSAVRARTFFTDLTEFPDAYDVWKGFFPKDGPASSTLGVPALQIPGARLMVDVIAVVPD